MTKGSNSPVGDERTASMEKAMNNGPANSLKSAVEALREPKPQDPLKQLKGDK
jgi:hypothetical protein